MTARIATVLEDTNTAYVDIGRACVRERRDAGGGISGPLPGRGCSS